VCREGGRHPPWAGRTRHNRGTWVVCALHDLVRLPRYDGPFVIRGERLGARGPIRVQSGAGGQAPRSGPLIVPAGPTLNTYYTSWRPEHERDRVTGRLLTAYTGYVPVGTWVRSPGCYGWQVDGRGFSEDIVIKMLAAGS
jgi:hypothetical protein